MTKREEEYGGDTRLQLPKGENVILPEQAAFIQREEGKTGGVEYKSTFEPLAHYLAARQITPTQARAGRRLFLLWRTSAFGEKYVTMRFGEPQKSEGGGNGTLVAQEYFDACKAIPNAFNRKVTLSVVCGGDFAGRGKFKSLLAGLDDLVRHFKY